MFMSEVGEHLSISGILKLAQMKGIAKDVFRASLTPTCY
jgi:hypothetical protein